MKKFILLLLLFPVFAFAQTNFTPQFKRNIPADSLIGYSIPGVTGNHWLPDTAWVKKHGNSGGGSTGINIYNSDGRISSLTGFRQLFTGSNILVFQSDTSAGHWNNLFFNHNAAVLSNSNGLQSGIQEDGAYLGKNGFSSSTYYKVDSLGSMSIIDGLTGVGPVADATVDTSNMSLNGRVYVIADWVKTYVANHSSGGGGNDSTIYKADGTLTGNRTVTTDNHTLSVGGSSGVYGTGIVLKTNNGPSHQTFIQLDAGNAVTNNSLTVDQGAFSMISEDLASGNLNTFSLSTSGAIYSDGITHRSVRVDSIATDTSKFLDWDLVPKKWVLDRITAHGGTSYTAGNGLTLTGTVFKADTSVLQTILDVFPRTDTRYYTKTASDAKYQTLANLETTLTNSATLYPSGSAVTAAIAAISSPTGANPTASIGFTAVNGSALTFTRSDAAPKADSTLIRSVANSLSLAQVQTKLNTKQNALGYTTTATAAGTTTLTVSSTGLQYFTGTTTQTVVLPVTSALTLGQQFEIVNNSTGLVTVQSSGANTIFVLKGNTDVVFTVISTSGTTATSWAEQYKLGVTSSNGNIYLHPSNTGLIGMSEDGTTGFYGRSGSSLDFQIGGTTALVVSSAATPFFNFKSTAEIGFAASDPTGSGIDIAIKRNAAGILEINNGTAGTFAALKASALLLSGLSASQGVATDASKNLISVNTPITQATADLTAQTSAGNVTTFTVGASTATFNVSTYINVTAVSVDVIQGQITYTDENSASQTVSLANISAIGNSTYNPVTIRAKNGTVITVKTNLTTGAGTITFDAGARITQL